MRIIAGAFRSRVILPPEDDQTTRPITDRVKQSLFDILNPLLDGAIVYDCFAGTGSMGLECLSRGAMRGHFFEADRSALGRLKKNIATLGVADRSTVVPGDLFKFFAHSTPPPEPVSVIFLDPPYRFLREQPERLRTLAEGLATHLSPEGVVIFRHDAADRLELPGLVRADERTYGGMTLNFLRRAS
ncbi:MAG: rRNA ((966)-N(2))-methyltransferase [Phycisphaerales bacterium]|nr:rRNA ((966)-N(2))-methyltransferase [Phycisphaerales bacterium]